MKRGQAAMEFLMTYGWALLIVLVAIAVLAKMGVFGGSVSYEACLAGTGLSCKDFKVQRITQFAPDDGRIEIQFLNGFGKDMYEFFVTIDPAMKACPGITGVVASDTLNSLTFPVPKIFRADQTLPIVGAITASQGMDCNNNGANCCSAHNFILSSVPSQTLRVPCQDPPGVGSGCTGIGPGGSGTGKLPNPGSRAKLDFFMTYKFGDSALLHSRKGYLVTTVQAPP